MKNIFFYGLTSTAIVLYLGSLIAGVWGLDLRLVFTGSLVAIGLWLASVFFA